MIWLVRLIVCCWALKLSLGEKEVQLNIPQGTLKGLKTTTTYHEMPMYSFKGIPYAKPNVGRDKFDVSVPLESWSGVLDATKHGNMCLFFCNIQQDVVGDEDCLFLNVYTPDVNKDAKRAVIVYIHGGGFNAGSGDDSLFGADFLIEKDVVVVTMNYRLGVLGFLNTGDANAPGNAGLKDQVLALKWVQDNIKNFGGCSKKVTIMGQGAGGASVQLHMLSPMSQDLFRGAIIQSGSAGDPAVLSYTPKEDAMALADELGIKASDAKELFDKLKDVSGKDLIVATHNMGYEKNILGGDMNVFVPSIEADVGQDVFLGNNPWELIKSGTIADVPTIIGLVADESAHHTDNIMARVSEFQDHQCKFIPKDLNMTDAARRREIADNLAKFYFDGKPVTEDNKNTLTDLISDVQFNHASVLTAGIMNARMSSPIYEYLFNFFTPLGLMKQIFHLKEGVIHCDELTFQFYSNFIDNIPAPGSPEKQKTDEMIEMWTNFAKEGDPSASMEMANIKWEPMGSDEKYLEIGNELEIKKFIFKERASLWADIYKDVLGDYTKLFV